MQWCHSEYPFAAGNLEKTNLENDGQSFDDKESAHQGQQNLLFRYDGDGTQKRTREREPTSPIKIWAG